MDKKNNLESILEFNKEFVKNKEYEKYNTTKTPDRKMVVVSCMDTRLTELLPQAMSIKNGDAKIIKNAGGVIIHPFGSAMRSILVSIYEFDVKEVYVVAHDECGMCNLNTSNTIQKMLDRGIDEATINTLYNSGIDVSQWLHGFSCIEESLKRSVSIVRNHPLLPKGIHVHGLIINPVTGKLRVFENGND
ncbi:carbonic anhydrase [Cetobacterium ceti]|uniref:Carbonic anhydrase n=1 Tax=Cetobacterium ceti TaxID=180163 RepID=A0A1T4QFM6_9FUSO|nr:carbonic anhydrase [Cetobacterium ceti]SKA02593.1 carbonic anhydrase [Cetobacterium ceti]